MTLLRNNMSTSKVAVDNYIGTSYDVVRTVYDNLVAINDAAGIVFIKAPVVASTTVNITLSGEQTIDTVAAVTGDRVLVRSQTDSTENGTYLVNTSAWTRTTDFNAAEDATNGDLILDSNSSILYSLVLSGTWTPDTTVITFIDRFTDSSNVTYTPSGTGAVATDVQTKLRESVSVKDFGAVGVGTDDTSSIQAAIDAAITAGGGTVYLPMTAGGGDYRVSVTKGTNDKYGLKITSSNIKFVGDSGVSLRRLSSDISTYALSFPILLIGSPDDNATQVTDVEVTGINFIGEDTRHTTSGSALMDGRQSIWVKNGKNIDIHHNKFTSIDSSSIWCQKPGDYDYENSAYYNTTKCYNINIKDNSFIADSHATAGRALLHAIVGRADNVKVLDNYFEWCDDCVSTTTSYDDYDDLETDTYTDSNLAVAVKRAGKGLVVKGNTCYNSSEHAFYLESMGVTCSGNTVTVDNSTVCNTTQMQIRGRGVTVADNTLTGVSVVGAINTGSMDVVFSNNTINSVGDSAGGVLNIQSQGLTTYIDNRSDFFGSYKPMKNIVVSGNVFNMPEAAQTNGVGIRLYTDSSDANFPDNQMQNVSITGNVFNRPKKAILNIANMARNVKIQNNIFVGKAFTEAAFTTGTTMNSQSVLAVDDGLTTPMQTVTFDNNTVYGFEYIMYDDGGAGGAGTMKAPFGIRGNRMDYVKYWDTAAFAAPTVDNMFVHNTGRQFLDVSGWYGTHALMNALYDGTSNSEKKSMTQVVAEDDVRYYYTDANDYVSMASSGRTTGGASSAGAGNQYVEVSIGGTTYKVLHDGTV